MFPMTNRLVQQGLTRLPVHYYAALYKTVFCKEVKKYDVRTEEIKTILKNPKEYLSSPNQKTKFNVSYDDPACRCAYLYKYAAFHAHIVQEMFNTALTKSNINFMPSTDQSFNICSIGGGPGIDIIAVLSVLQLEWGFFNWSAKTIENMCGWKDTLTTILTELQNGCEVLPSSLYPFYFDWDYVVADQLVDMNNSLKETIGSADLIVMPKFGSSTAAVESAQLIKHVFDSMRPGAIFFFIGSAYGGYSQLVYRLGQDCSMMSAYGPSRNILYENTIIKPKKKFGSNSCFIYPVSAQLLIKPYPYTLPNEYGLTLFQTGTTRLKGYVKTDCVGGNSQKWKSKKDDTVGIRLYDTEILRDAEYRSSGVVGSKQIIKSCLDIKSDFNVTVDCSIIKLNNTDVSHDEDHEESNAGNSKTSAISCTDSTLNASNTVDSGSIRLDYEDVLPNTDHITKCDTNSKTFTPRAAVKASEKGAIELDSEYNQDIFGNIKSDLELSYSKPNLDQISLFPNSLDSSELKGSSSGHNYPLYEMFPEDFYNENCKSNEFHLKMAKSSPTTTDDCSAQTKSILKDGVDTQDGQKCKYCFKLRRISWLQNNCRFCKKLDNSVEFLCVVG